MDRGARCATVHGVAKSWTWLSDQQGTSVLGLGPMSFPMHNEDVYKTGMHFFSTINVLMPWVWRMLGLTSTELVGRERNWGQAVLSSQGDTQFVILHYLTEHRGQAWPRKVTYVHSDVIWGIDLMDRCWMFFQVGSWKLINFHPLSIDSVIHKSLIYRWESQEFQQDREHQSPSQLGACSEQFPHLCPSSWSKATDFDSSSLKHKIIY